MKKYFRSLFSAFLPSQINQFHKEVNSYINYQEKGAKLYRAGQYYLALKAMKQLF